MGCAIFQQSTCPRSRRAHVRRVLDHRDGVLEESEADRIFDAVGRDAEHRAADTLPCARAIEVVASAPNLRHVGKAPHRAGGLRKEVRFVGEEERDAEDDGNRHADRDLHALLHDGGAYIGAGDRRPTSLAEPMGSGSLATSTTHLTRLNEGAPRVSPAIKVDGLGRPRSGVPRRSEHPTHVDARPDTRF